MCAPSPAALCSEGPDRERISGADHSFGRSQCFQQGSVRGTGGVLSRCRRDIGEPCVCIGRLVGGKRQGQLCVLQGEGCRSRVHSSQTAAHTSLLRVLLDSRWVVWPRYCSIPGRKCTSSYIVRGLVWWRCRARIGFFERGRMLSVCSIRFRIRMCAHLRVRFGPLRPRRLFFVPLWFVAILSVLARGAPPPNGAISGSAC